ncbi:MULTISPECIES: type II secretion system protein GspM [Corallincola]|uniref:Type II secretion system protein M n=2 Tax=Corallincola TaxID=1775176 RepID=A0ABY1WQ52_9GAMM|nr:MULTISPECIES: type II secretion system protein M [Corallincola]TAA46077.1 type II secretion system protein M [Corallincola spongiicola]TCI01441.1 type II secretion system protein M [Corallincola luteus]
MNALKTYLDGLDVREKQLLAMAAVAVVVAIFYWGFWSPLNNAVADEQQALSSAESRLAEMKRAAVEVVNLRASTGKGNVRSGSLSSIVNRTAKAQKVVIARIQPQGEDLQVWIDRVAFNDFLRWLQILKQQYGIDVGSLDLTSEQETGVVRIRRLQLRRG